MSHPAVNRVLAAVVCHALLADRTRSQHSDLPDFQILPRWALTTQRPPVNTCRRQLGRFDPFCQFGHELRLYPFSGLHFHSGRQVLHPAFSPRAGNRNAVNPRPKPKLLVKVKEGWKGKNVHGCGQENNIRHLICLALDRAN
ncbi:hypothetical protein DPEC_G00057250 [Dallia pectoralis]|uniref:Uncharacterized protein n=1 Tax=Dallia pectoralis TaxID=75939 RepID=A0ACC2H5U4_DALPE|nr:hypothetical protein DPEC_G00057250 [Dallia pectoralis]